MQQGVQSWQPARAQEPRPRCCQAWLRKLPAQLLAQLPAWLLGLLVGALLQAQKGGQHLCLRATDALRAARMLRACSGLYCTW